LAPAAFAQQPPSPAAAQRVTIGYVPGLNIKPGNDGGEAVAAILRPFERDPL